MTLAVAMAVAFELGILDDNFRPRVAAAKNAILVVVKVAVANGQTGAFQADCRAIPIRHACSGELDVLHRHIVAPEYPDALALGGGTMRGHVGNAARSPDGQVILLPDGDIAVVGARVDLDGVAIPGKLGRDARQHELTVRPDAQGLVHLACRRAGGHRGGAGKRHGHHAGDCHADSGAETHAHAVDYLGHHVITIFRGNPSRLIRSPIVMEGCRGLTAVLAVFSGVVSRQPPSRWRFPVD